MGSLSLYGYPKRFFFYISRVQTLGKNSRALQNHLFSVFECIAPNTLIHRAMH